MLEWVCQLHTAGLQPRLEAWRRQGVCLTDTAQADERKRLRAEVPELGNPSVSAEQQVLRRLTTTVNAVFGRPERLSLGRSETRLQTSPCRPPCRRQ